MSVNTFHNNSSAHMMNQPSFEWLEKEISGFLALMNKSRQITSAHILSPPSSDRQIENNRLGFGAWGVGAAPQKQHPEETVNSLLKHIS